MLGACIGLVVTVVVAWMIVKKYKAQAVLILGGIVLMACALMFGMKSSLLSAKTTTGFVWFDIFEFLKITFSSRAAGLGLIIMSVAGFAKYMDRIGASEALVRLAIKPLGLFHAPYLVLSLGFLLGQVLHVFIPSASGLGLLLMVTMFPILVKLGVSRLSATAMIGTTSCIDLGPGSGNSALAAKTANLEVVVYFVKYQIPAAIFVLLCVAVAHYFVQKWFDKREGHVVQPLDKVELANEAQASQVPMIYVLLPIIPLVLILVFSDLFVKTIKMDVITAMFIGIFVSMIFEYVRYRDAKRVLSSIQVFFDGMGVQFATVVTLIVAGEAFALGLVSVGAIDFLIDSAQGAGLGVIPMVVVMTAIISVSAVVMGSGNAPFFAFSSLAPTVASKLGAETLLLVLPMQFASSMARSISPITAVIVAVSGVANVNPVDVVKRTAIPMVVGLVATVVANFTLF